MQDKPEISDIQSQIAESGRKVSETIDAAKDDLTVKAHDLASEGKEALTTQAHAVQNNLSGAIATFGGAIRAASEHLANSHHKSASRFALEAAGGLERISSSLRDKPFEDVLREVKSFGAQNPGALMGGSVLAGLALGRFIKSTSPSDEASRHEPQSGEGPSSSAFEDPQTLRQESEQ
ncbi:hypothetical protein [Mesorhizobium metallidurans]|nr:hypothetical protein [Mesorhizobium metallidurans]